jgi:bis(5'-nucleosyl)-tetraphosphatase (symmetrical)
MTTWAIGDIQGCHEALRRLLEAIRFDPAKDRLWFCGDLVNRGGESLEVLRLVRSLDASSVTVLGNHDLALLSIAEREEDEQQRVNPDLRRVLFAPDRDELIGWLRERPLVHVDEKLGWMLVHAGLAPKWTAAIARKRAAEVERRLRGKARRKLLRNMYGDKPAAWRPRLQGIERQRAIINVCTRLRFCDVKGRMDFEAKGAPGTQKPGLYPWFEVPGRVATGLRVVCGHWSTLGLFMGLGVYGIDTGCVWGGPLTALALEDALRIVQVPGRKGATKPSQLD